MTIRVSLTATDDQAGLDIDVSIESQKGGSVIALARRALAGVEGAAARRYPLDEEREIVDLGRRAGIVLPVDDETTEEPDDE